jgi:predicted HTH domain antitoxin
MLKVRDFVEARLYDDEEAVIQDALRHLLRARVDLRTQMAVHHYQTEEISLAKAASLAGVSWAQMKDILVERGIQPRLGPETIEEAQKEVEALRDYFEGQQ